MNDLYHYVLQHTRINPNIAPSAVTFDMVLTKIEILPGEESVSSERLLQLIAEHRALNPELDLFDQREHSYIEVGAWIGDQGVAFGLIALGAYLKLWQLLTPYTILGPDFDKEVARTMAGRGYVGMKV